MLVSHANGIHFQGNNADAGKIGTSHMRKRLILHPIFFALLPIISLLAVNIVAVTIPQVFRSIIVITASTIFFWVLLNAIINDWHKSAFIVSIFLVLFFSYGNVYELIEGATLADITLGRHGFLLPAWIGMFVISIMGVIRISNNIPNISKILNFIAGIVLVISTYEIVTHEIRLHQLLTENLLPDYSSENPPKVSDIQEKPDIFYIILDGYGREDILQEIYGFDNSEFIGFLKDRGFYIADRSRCNYGQTTLSLASSLNMDYLDFVIDLIGEETMNQRPITRLILHSKVRYTLESLGYQTVAFATGYRRTAIADADIYYRPPQKYISHFESILIGHSALVILQELSDQAGWHPLYPGYAAQRQKIEYTLEHLPELADNNVPDFVFAHILAPHPPFVFGPNGEELNPPYPFTIEEGEEFPGRTHEYIEGYRGQIAYINKRLEQVIEEIQDREKVPPIIILQADHGPGSELNWENPQETNLRERMSIFNAYYLPGRADDLLYESISPVNSFRIVFNQFFETDYAILQDESYFSSWIQPYNFINFREEQSP